MEWYDPLKALLWAIDRPQQAIFQGARAGANAFEKNLHLGNEMSPFSSAVMSIPEFAKGAAKGLTGTGEDIYGGNLTGGLEEHMPFGLNEEHPEWNKPHVEALSNFLNISASPMDVMAPVGKAARVPYATYKNLAAAAPEYRQAAMQLGTPMTKLKDYLSQGVRQFGEDARTMLGGIRDQATLASNKLRDPMSAIPNQPGFAMSAAETGSRQQGATSLIENLKNKAQEAAGVYGNYFYAPSSVSSPHPMILRSPNKDMSGVIQAVLGEGAPSKLGAKNYQRGLWTARGGGNTRNPLNMVFATMNRALPFAGNQVFGHELGHMLSSFLRGRTSQSPEKILKAVQQLTSMVPDVLKGKPRGLGDTEAIAGKMHAYRQGLTDRFPRETLQKSGVGYAAEKIPEELLADMAAGRLYAPASDRIGQAMKAMTQNRTWSPREAWDPWKYAPMAPTVPLAQGGRAARNPWRE